MVMTTTTAAALAAGSALDGVAPADRTVGALPADGLAGALMIAAGVAARPLYALRVALGHDRIPHRRRGEHLLRPARRSVRRGRAGQLDLAKAINVLLHPGRSISLAARGARRPRAGRRSSPAPRSRRSGRSSRSPSRASSCSARARSRRVSDAGEIPRGLPLPHLPASRRALAERRRRRHRGGRHRARAGRGRRRVCAQHRRLALQVEPRFHRAGHRQRRVRALPRSAGRRIGGPDRPQRRLGRRSRFASIFSGSGCS